MSVCPQVQLFDHTIRIKQFALQLDFVMQICQVTDRALGVFSNYLVAGAVVANVIAKWQIEIQRQRSGDWVLVTLLSPGGVISGGNTFVELVCRRIRGVTWARLIVAFYQFRIKCNVVSH